MSFDPALNATSIVRYPAVPELITSEIYTVTVGEEVVWTECLRSDLDLSSLPAWFTNASYVNEQQEVHIANLSCGGPNRIRIEVPQPIARAAVRPESRGIETTVRGRALEFVLCGPGKVYVNIDDLPPLLVFASQLESEVPKPGAPGVRFFGPGVHRPGVMDLNDDEAIYLAGGAVVYGAIRAEGVSGVRVIGRGILDGGYEHRLVYLKESRNITFRGVMLRNGQGWTNTLENCDNALFQDVKVISFGPSGDGINPVGSRNVRIDDCFLRCTDDCIAIKSPDRAMITEHIRVTNCTMVGFAFSDGVTIGFETNGPRVSDVLVKNCDILQARGGSRVDGHSAFSIICDGPAEVSGIRYEDIRVEEDVLKLFELHVTDGKIYGKDPPGRIADIHLKKISWASVRPIVLHGFGPENRVTHVTFEACTIAGKPLTEARSDVLSINAFVDNVRFVKAADGER